MTANINNCPSCYKFRSVQLKDNFIACDSCSFKLKVLCPYCNVGQLSSYENDQFNCDYCHEYIQKKKLSYILENRLMVDLDNLCHSCNRPMLSRKEMNIKPRCFNHPACGNQQSLFFDGVQTEYVFIDFETTGLDIGNESIIEIGACKVDANGKECFFQEFVKPVSEISSLITKITGITDNMVKNSPSLNDTLKALIKFCGKASIVAHNAQFDIPWLITSLIRHNIQFDFSNVCCTLKWAKTKEEGKRSLGALSKKYEIGHDNAHRAMADAVVTKELFYIYEGTSSSIPLEPIDRYVDISKKIISQHPSFFQS